VSWCGERSSGCSAKSGAASLLIPAFRLKLTGIEKAADENAKHTPFFHKSFTARGGRTRQYGEIMARAELIAQTLRPLLSSPSNPHHCHFLPPSHDMLMKTNAFHPSHWHPALLHSPRTARASPALNILTRGGAAR
jgi:hypothetical protein